MTEFGFGQKIGEIVQIAYVVENMEEAIAWWVENTGAGPFFLLESFTGDDQVYRGGPAKADVRIAMGYSGHTQIELIQPKDSHPSVYKETIDARGYGFHHLGYASADVEADIETYRARGFELAFYAPVPTGGAVAYMDGGASQPGFVELIPATSGMDAGFTRFWEASLNWDGKDPIRPFM